MGILSFSTLFRVLFKWDKMKADRFAGGSTGKLGELDKDVNFLFHFI